jgi:hypothetical protein
MPAFGPMKMPAFDVDFMNEQQNEEDFYFARFVSDISAHTLST